MSSVNNGFDSSKTVTQTYSRMPDPFDHTISILCAGLVFFTIALLLAAFLFPADRELRTLFSGVVTGFAGSLFTYIQKPPK